LCGVYFVFKYEMIVYYTGAEDLTDGVNPKWIVREALFYLI